MTFPALSCTDAALTFRLTTNNRHEHKPEDDCESCAGAHHGLEVDGCPRRRTPIFLFLSATNSSIRPSDAARSKLEACVLAPIGIPAVSGFALAFASAFLASRCARR